MVFVLQERKQWSPFFAGALINKFVGFTFISNLFCGQQSIIVGLYENPFPERSSHERLIINLTQLIGDIKNM